MSKISSKLDKEVRARSKNRCGYCLAPQLLTSYKLEIEHIYPQAKGGTDDAANLCLACRSCNSYKAVKVYGVDPISLKRVRLFNPNRHSWAEHFAWDASQTAIIGNTPCGRATVEALQMNGDWQKTARRFWKLTGIFPPPDGN